MDENSVLLTVSQAARAAGYSAQHVRRLADTGAITVVVTPYGRLVPREAVDRLIARRQASREPARRRGGGGRPDGV